MLPHSFLNLAAAASLPPSPAHAYWPIALLLAMALSFGVIVLAIARLVSPRRSGPVKDTAYESGMDPINTARKRFNIRFYLLAVTFLVFDVEIIFLYPWAATFRQIDPHSDLAALFVGRIVFFLAASIVAYVYAWKKGVFRFD